MEFTIHLSPNQQCIDFIDCVMESYMGIYDHPFKKEICFVVHELIINSVEAMENMPQSDTESIELTVTCKDGELVIQVIDEAGGIAEEEWEQVVQYDLGDLAFSDRGRGLFFVKNMVDSLTFQHLSKTKFLVKASKKLEIV